MRRPMLLLFFLALALSSTTTAWAADWPLLLGTEEVGDGHIRPVGFVQLSAKSLILAEPVSGLTSEKFSSRNGQLPLFNTQSSDLEFRMRRLRAGLRGAVPHTDKKVNFFFNADFGQAPATRENGYSVLDASITVSAIPYVRLRLGQFKVPTADEALEVVPLVMNFIDYSLPMRHLLLENRIVDGKAVGDNFAFRDVGAMAFDTLPFGDFRLSYAVMVHQGQKGALDVDNHKDATARLQLSYVLGGKGPFRNEVSAFAWANHGTRVIDDEDVVRARQGAGVFARYKLLRVRAEVVAAQGVITVAPLFAGDDWGVLKDGHAVGHHVDIAVETGIPLTLSAGFAQLFRQWGEGTQARMISEATSGVHIHITRKVRLMGEVRLRHIYAPEAPSDVQRIVDTIAPMATVQAGVMF